MLDALKINYICGAIYAWWYVFRQDCDETAIKVFCVENTISKKCSLGLFRLLRFALIGVFCLIAFPRRKLLIKPFFCTKNLNMGQKSEKKREKHFSVCHNEKKVPDDVCVCVCVCVCVHACSALPGCHITDRHKHDWHKCAHIEGGTLKKTINTNRSKELLLQQREKEKWLAFDWR